MDSVRIRKCASPICSDIIGVWERPNKKYCSQECKTKAHNRSAKYEVESWDKIIERYKSEKTETTIISWLKENYYPPRKIKHKK
jgi:hypothetical protein